MKTFAIAFLSFLVVVHANVLQLRSVEAYSWRDYNGLIPSDAVKAGKDDNGQTTYIGQFTTLAEYNFGKTPIHTIPATIKPGSRKAFAPYAGRVIHSNYTTNTKILCYESEYRYKWFTPTSSFPPNCRFVVAGNEDGFPMFVGRGSYNKEVVLGKIFSDNTNHREGLIAAHNGIEVFPEQYEILTHCP